MAFSSAFDNIAFCDGVLRLCSFGRLLRTEEAELSTSVPPLPLLDSSRLREWPVLDVRRRALEAPREAPRSEYKDTAGSAVASRWGLDLSNWTRFGDSGLYINGEVAAVRCTPFLDFDGDLVCHLSPK